MTRPLLARPTDRVPNVSLSLQNRVREVARQMSPWEQPHYDVILFIVHLQYYIIYYMCVTVDLFSDS